jgi:hypothetical protein
MRHRGNPKVTEENFKDLKEEMSQPEVEALFGGPGEVGWAWTNGFVADWEGPDVFVSLIIDWAGVREARMRRRGSRVREDVKFLRRHYFLYNMREPGARKAVAS